MEITEQTLLEFGFEKINENIDSKYWNIENSAVEKYTLPLPKGFIGCIHCFNIDGTWHISCNKYINGHPTTGTNEVDVNVETIEDIQLSMKCAKIDFELKKKEK